MSLVDGVEEGLRKGNRSHVVKEGVRTLTRSVAKNKLSSWLRLGMQSRAGMQLGGLLNWRDARPYAARYVGWGRVGIGAVMGIDANVIRKMRRHRFGGIGEKVVQCRGEVRSTAQPLLGCLRRNSR